MVGKKNSAHFSFRLRKGNKHTHSSNVIFLCLSYIGPTYTWYLTAFHLFQYIKIVLFKCFGKGNEPTNHMEWFENVLLQKRSKNSNNNKTHMHTFSLLYCSIFFFFFVLLLLLLLLLFLYRWKAYAYKYEKRHKTGSTWSKNDALTSFDESEKWRLFRK